MKNVILLMFVLLNIFNQVNAQELEMTLLVEKNNYLEQEPITALLVLQNISSKEIDVRDFGSEANGASVKLIVQDESSNLINYHGGIVDAVFIEPNYLEPGNTTNTVFFIGRSYGNNDPQTNNGFNVVLLASYIARRFLTEGTYNIYAEYKYRHGNVVKSNVIEINVQKPYSDAQMQVYRELKKAVAQFDSGNLEEYYSILLNIINNYPDNPYTKVAYTQIFINANEKKLDNERIKRLIIDYTEHFGNSIETFLNIYKKLYELKDSEFIIKIMKQLNNEELNKYLLPYRDLYLKE